MACPVLLSRSSTHKARGNSSPFNAFVPNAPFLYPLKTENLIFSGGREKVCWEGMRQIN